MRVKILTIRMFYYEKVMGSRKCDIDETSREWLPCAFVARCMSRGNITC